MENENMQSPKLSIFARLNIFKSTIGKDILNEAIKKIIYVLVFLIPIWFLPITINAVELNKQVVMVLLIIASLILWSIKILNRGEIKWKSNILNVAFGVFALICIISTIFSIRPYGSLVGWSDHLSGSLINILCFIALYFLIVNNFKELKETFNLLFIFTVSSAIVSVIGMLQIWGKFILPFGITKIISFNTIGSVNTLGIFVAVMTILITAMLFMVKRKGIKLFLILLGLLNIFILISINFWVLWLVLGVGMIIILLFGLMQMVKLGEKISWIALPITLLAVALIFLFFRPVLPLRPNLPIEVGLSYKSGLSIVGNVLRHNPIIGTGPETFVFNYAKYKPEGINQTAYWNVRFLNAPAKIYSLASDLGILGLLGFLAIIIIFAVKATKNLIKEKEESNILKRFLSIGFFAAWIGIAVCWFIYSQNLVLMFVFWLLLSLFLTEESTSKEKVYDLKKSPKILLIASISFMVIIVLVIGLLYVIGTKYIAEITYKRGVSLIETNENVNNGLNKIIKSTIINPHEDNTYKVLSQLFIYKLEQDAVNTALTQAERANIVQTDAMSAINSAMQTTNLSPRDASNWLLRGQVYRKLMAIIDGASDWEESSYNKAIEFEPSNPFVYLELGRLYANKADMIVEKARNDQETRKTWNEYIAKAMENFNKSIELKINYSDAYYEQSKIYDRQGKIAEAIQKLEINRQLSPSDKNIAFQLAVLYYRSEKFKQAKAEFIRAIVLDDNFSNARYFLGLLYDWEGDRESAFDQFDRIAELNPDNEQIKDILENLNAGKPALGKPISAKTPAELLVEEQPINQ
jgi:tetratricopeptide (TPR) repeat protein